MRAEYVPTLLHFSAMYGLRDLTAALLQCPGAVQAYGTANCDGDYPTNLAEKSGHWDLRDFMQTYMEVAAMVHNDYSENGNNMQTSQIMSSMVYGQYLSFAGDVGVPEDIYVPIGGGLISSINTPEGYLPMHPASQGADLPQSVDYDFMIKRMLQSDEEESGKEVYETLDPLPPPPDLPPMGARRASALLCAPVDETPPLPPPREPKFMSTGCVDPQDSMLMLPKFSSNLSAAQEELIALQKKVKTGEVTINQAVFRFKEWERKHKETAASFQYQQENLQRLRISLMKSRDDRKQRGQNASIKISEPLVAGSSTYDKVLLKTRREVMVDAYGGVERKNEKRPSMERRPEARQNEYTQGCEENSFSSRASSFKKQPSFSGRPPVPTPASMTDRFSTSRFRASLSSQGSSMKSSSSESSNPTSFRQMGMGPVPLPRTRSPAPPPQHPPIGSFMDHNRPSGYSPTLYNHQEVWNSPYPAGGEAPPPVPPRDDQDRGPNVPPRNPLPLPPRHR